MVSMVRTITAHSVEPVLHTELSSSEVLCLSIKQSLTWEVPLHSKQLIFIEGMAKEFLWLEWKVPCWGLASDFILK